MMAVKTEYRVQEGAELVGCHANTLRRLDKVGIIKAHRDYRGHRIFLLQDLLKLKANRHELKDEE